MCLKLSIVTCIWLRIHHFSRNLFPEDSILVPNKRCQNLKNLLVRGHRYNIKHDLTDIVSHQNKPCGKKYDSFDNFIANQSYVISNATGRNYYIRRDSTLCAPNVVYIAYCKKCKNQRVGTTLSWKQRLRNYKSHIKKNVPSCRIVTHFIVESCDEEISFKYLASVILDVVNNTSGLTRNQIDNLLLEKEKLWIGTIVTWHQGLNSTHEWSRSKRTEREKINN